MKIKLKEIIGQFLSSADQSSHQFLRLWNMGVFGLQTEFNLDITGELKTVLLEVNANKTASLPHDYITYSKIGVLNNSGEVVTFNRNSRLSSYNSFQINSECRGGNAPTINTGTDSVYSYNHGYYHNFFQAGEMYQLFGAASGTPSVGEYKLDESNKLILLDKHSMYDNIVLEYLGDGFEDNDYAIDVRAAEAMIAYLRWKNAIDANKKFSPAQVNVLKREYYREKRLAKMRLNPFKIGEFNDITRKAIKLTVKA